MTEIVPLNAQSVLRKAIEQQGPKAVAEALGVSLSIIYKWSEDKRADASANPIERTLQLMQASHNDVLVSWLCQRAGGVFVKNPEAKHTQPVDVLIETQRILKEFSDVLLAVSHAYADGRVTIEEAHRIRDEWDELKSIAETFVRHCEGKASG